jgi:hypothetical protein
MIIDIGEDYHFVPEKKRPPNCLKCRYFRVSWDVALPRSCELFAIKCRDMPSAEVFRASGVQCPSFSLKENLKNFDKNA